MKNANTTNKNTILKKVCLEIKIITNSLPITSVTHAE